MASFRPSLRVVVCVAALAAPWSQAHAQDPSDEWDDPKPAEALGLPQPSVPGATSDPSRAIFRDAELAALAGRKGTLAGDLVKGVVREHLAEIRFCYERARSRKADVSGRVTVRFVVREDGTVVAARVDSSSVDDEPLERCVVAAVRRWSFPKPSGTGAAILSWPFSFVAL